MRKGCGDENDTRSDWFKQRARACFMRSRVWAHELCSRHPPSFLLLLLLLLLLLKIKANLWRKYKKPQLPQLPLHFIYRLFPSLHLNLAISERPGNQSSWLTWLPSFSKETNRKYIVASLAGFFNICFQNVADQQQWGLQDDKRG